MKMTKYDRLLFIMNLIRGRRNLNAALLATECGVTERTIYRDIISLSEANVPIYYDNGYKYAANNFLPPLNFDIDEYVTLVRALESSPLNQSGKSGRIVKQILSKIDAVLSPDLRRQRYSTAPAEVKIKSTMPSKNVSDYLSILERCVQNSQSIEIVYNSISSGKTKRAVDPHFLIFIERAFYFVGFCHLRKEARTFRADRIDSIKPLEQNFKPSPKINPKDYFRNSWGVFRGEKINVEIEFYGSAARVVKLGNHHKTEELNERGDKLIYKASVNGDVEVLKWVLGFGSEAKIIKPKYLSDKLRQILCDLKKKYE